MKTYKEIYKEEGLILKGLEENSLVTDVREMISRRFNKSDDYYLDISREKFHDICLEAQKELNTLNIQHRFFESERELFESIFPHQELLHESVVFLRAVRPITKKIKMEAPDFHRETWYNDQSHTPFCINTWIPIKNVDKRNTLKYYPNSHKIADEDLSIEVDHDAPGKIKKFSSGHQLGFLWKPKKLKEDIDIGTPQTMNFFENSFSIFSPMLVHGGAENHSDKIRFAIGFGMIPAEKMTYNKNFFASDGKPHYVPFN